MNDWSCDGSGNIVSLYVWYLEHLRYLIFVKGECKTLFTVDVLYDVLAM
jgi:hypothetical protein